MMQESNLTLKLRNVVFCYIIVYNNPMKCEKSYPSSTNTSRTE